jgi:hypothetical protein
MDEQNVSNPAKSLDKKSHLQDAKKLSKKKKFVSKKKTSEKVSKSTFWNGYFTLATLSLVLAILAVLALFEDIQYRKIRKEQMQLFAEFENDGRQVTHSNLSRNIKAEYRQSIKLAMGYYKKFRQNPKENLNDLQMSYAQFKIAKGQLKDFKHSQDMAAKLEDRMDKIKNLLVKNDLWQVSNGDSSSNTDNSSIGEGSKDSLPLNSEDSKSSVNSTNSTNIKRDQAQ